ncbi:MAG: 2-oxoglutarate dehydrogenase, E2 component, dihydrolipoamide succinyltransferase, partial [Deltaproteobacteria bacterium]|nr:2-oxoglutarate dehydrogenase, E2 component, dihydrolipoamide succinyltransferase [Deltaproteobacteria bacterium]
MPRPAPRPAAPAPSTPPMTALSAPLPRRAPPRPAAPAAPRPAVRPRALTAILLTTLAGAQVGAWGCVDPIATPAEGAGGSAQSGAQGGAGVGVIGG